MRCIYLLESTLLLFCLISASLQERNPPFESGITTLMVQRTQGQNLGHDVAFSLSFREGFHSPPLALVAPLTFANDPSLAIGHHLRDLVWARIQMKSTNENKVELAIESSLQSIVLKISYLFISEEVARSAGIYIMKPVVSLEYNHQLDDERRGVVKIREIVYDQQGKEERVSREGYGVLPFENALGKYYIFSNELKLIQKGKNYYDLILKKKENSLQVKLVHNTDLIISLETQIIAYTLVLQLENHTPHQNFLLSFKQMLVSIPAISISRQIGSEQSLFVGLSGYFLEESQDFLSVDFTQAQKAYLISRRRPSSMASLFNMTVLSLSEQQPSESSSYTSRLLLTCPSPTYQTTYVNSWTTWSFPASSSTPTCQACPTGCYSCGYSKDCYRYVNCTVCRTGFSLQDFNKNKQKVCKCTSGFPNSITNTCMACENIIANCVSCYQGSSGHFSATCATCKTGYYGVPNTGSWSGSIQCGLCVPGCGTCTNIPTNCSGCATGFTKAANGSCICSVAGTYYNAATMTCTTCVLAVPNCATCILGVTNTCSACLPGFYINAGACVQCQPNCNACVLGSCTTCLATFVASGASCVCSTTPQMVLNAAGTTCVLCTSLVPSCAVCAGTGTAVTCTTCTAGAYPATPTSCLPCPTTCATCDATTCLTCLNNLIIVGTGCDCNTGGGFYLNTLTNTCISCQQTFPACTGCSTPLSVLTCDTCNPLGFYVTPSGCAACPTTCKSCTDSTTCLTCVTGYQLGYNGAPAGECACVNCITCDSAGVPYCVSCDLSDPNPLNYFCNICDASSFLTTGSPGTCTSCPLECATCLNAANCLTCQPAFIMSTPPGSCICNSLALKYYTPGPPPDCVSCLLVTGMSADCTACAPTGTNTGDPAACTACLPGSFVTGGNCSPCTYPCSTCTTTSTTCTACVATYILSGSNCVCDNAHQIFENTAISTKVCQGCTTLLGTTQCQVCSLNSAAVLTSGVACTTCQPGTYPDASFLCSPCPSTCTTCTDFTTCTTCLSTYTLLVDNSCACDTVNSIYPYGSICLSCHAIFNYCQTCDPSGGSIVCSACGTGTYVAPDKLSCILCPLNCDDCSAGGVCTTCSPGHFKNGAGVCDCNTTCVAYSNADPSCLECGMSAIDPVTNVSSLQCHACKLTTFLFGSEICNACPPSCATCKDYVTCLTCLPSYNMVNSNCQCNIQANFVDDGSGVCKSCGFLSPGCYSCRYASGVTTCTGCIDGYVLDSGVCLACGFGCQVCTVVAGITAGHCVKCFFPDFSLNIMTFYCVLADSLNPCLYTDSLYYDGFGSSTCSTPCADPFCATCYDGATCTTCKGTFEYIMGQCVCNAGQGMFLDRTILGSESCLLCQASAYLTNCKICNQNLLSTYASKIECLQCADEFYLSGGTCLSCMAGCQKCTTSTTCCSCNSPSWLMVAGTCDCNNNLNYFTDNAGHCLTCNIPNCTKCSALTTCIACNLDSFVNGAGACQLSVCGNGATEGIEQCDDGNAIAGDGCTACAIDPYYFCINTPPPSICLYDNRFNVKVATIEAACNKITIKFQIYPYYNYYDGASFDSFINTNTLNASLKLTGYTRSADTVSYSYTYNKKLQGLPVNFILDPTALMIPQTYGYPPISVTFNIVPTNNVLALYYEDDVCKSTSSLKKLAAVVEYGSYATMALSVLPSKIVGLELTGVLQLVFFSMASMDNVNIMMSPLMGLKGINGYAMGMGKDPEKKRLLQAQTLTPSRINSIGYNANFLRNCNVMLMLVLAVIGIAFTLYIITYIFKKCAETLHRVAKRMIKEVLLTMILFNCLNFAYSAGVHFRYAVPEDSLYLFGTLAAAATLIMPVLMAIGLSMTEEEGFGEFKDKMKPGCIEKAYFVITIIYRMCLGLYMSSSNEDELSTLIVLGLSIGFLLYNLVNLPFTKAYHNYRANICHFCQFIVLFVAMYYRSMKSSASSDQVANIYSPVYLEYACITISLVVSLVVLFYDGYIWLKECCSGDKEKRDHNRVAPREHGSNSDASEVENKLHVSMKSIESEGNQPPIDIKVGEESEFYN